MVGAYGSEGWSVLFGLGMVFHMLFCMVLFFGLLSGVVWMFRFATVKELRKLFKLGVMIGVIGLILSAPLMFWGAQSWEGTRSGTWDEDSRGRGMMDWYFDDETSTTTETVVE